jgi:hypothetical protein
MNDQNHFLPRSPLRARLTLQPCSIIIQTLIFCSQLTCSLLR